MFFTLTFPNKVHHETKSKKPKLFFFAFQQSQVLHETSPGFASSKETMPVALGQGLHSLAL